MGENRKYHYIYKITCLKNGKYYIGMHSTDNLNDGYMGGGKIIKNSINKYGKEEHIKEIIGFFSNREDLINKEIELVNENLLKDPMCMNLQLGGGGGIINEEHHNKMKKGASEFMKKSWKNSKFDKNRIISSKRMKSLHQMGKIPYDTFTGRTHTSEAKEKIGKANSIKQKGIGNSQYGKRWITNGEENKKISSDEKIPEGWRFGRKM